MTIAAPVWRGARHRAAVIQKNTGRPVQCEIIEQTRAAFGAWLAALDARKGRYLFPSRFEENPDLSTREYGRIVLRWADRAGTKALHTANTLCAERSRLKFKRRPAIWLLNFEWMI
jgi:hypothetical protein